MLTYIISLIADLMVLGGVFFIFTGAMGVLRMPDFYTRTHPAGLADSLGAPLVLAGIAVHYGFSVFSLKLILLIVFLLITNPAATHALAKAAILSGLEPWVRGKK